MRPGSLLEPAVTVRRVDYGHVDGIVNPITSTGTVLAAGPTGPPVLASVYAEWIAKYMLGVTVYPLPASLSNGLSAFFPAHVQVPCVHTQTVLLLLLLHLLLVLLLRCCYYSALFPAHVQAFYDSWLEPANSGRARIEAAMRVIPPAFVPLVVAAADMTVATGLAAFALNPTLTLAIGILAAAAMAHRVAKA